MGTLTQGCKRINHYLHKKAVLFCLRRRSSLSDASKYMGPGRRGVMSERDNPGVGVRMSGEWISPNDNSLPLQTMIPTPPDSRRKPPYCTKPGALHFPFDQLWSPTLQSQGFKLPEYTVFHCGFKLPRPSTAVRFSSLLDYLHPLPYKWSNDMF